MRKERFKAILAIFSAFLLLLPSSCGTVKSICESTQTSLTESAGEWTPKGDYSAYFGWNALETVENGKAMQYAYDQICSAVNDSITNVSFDTRLFRLDRKTFNAAYLVYCYDHPEHFWLDQTSYSTTYSDEGVLYEVVFTYLFEGEALEKAREAMNSAILSIKESIPNDLIGTDDAYEFELCVHDRIAEWIDYEETEYAHTAYGALVDGKAVCEGYAKAFELIMQSFGFTCYMVVGEGREDIHGWDLVKLGDDWCYVDATWDDTDDDYVSHAFFNMTTEMMLRLRTPYEAPFELPLCENEELFYYNRSEKMLSSPFDENALSLLLQEGNGRLTVMVENDDDVNALIEFINSNFTSIATGAGYPDAISASYHLVDREVHLSLDA